MFRAVSALLFSSLVAREGGAEEARFKLTCSGSACAEAARNAVAQGNLRLARTAYGEACKAGLSNACAMFRAFLARAIGGAPEPIEVKEVLGALCRSGAISACAELGEYLHQYGVGSKDHAAALSSWRAACYPTTKDPGDATSCFHLGLHGEEARRAVRHIQRSCALGYERACLDVEEILAVQARVARCYPSPGGAIDGEACLQLAQTSWLWNVEVPNAEGLHDQGCTAGHARSCFEAAQDRMSPDPAEALTLYRKSCKLGDADACAWLNENARLPNEEWLLSSDRELVAFGSMGTPVLHRSDDTRFFQARAGFEPGFQDDHSSVPISTELYYSGSYLGAIGHGFGFRETFSLVSWPRRDESTVSPLNLGLGWTFEGQWFREDGFDWTHGPFVQNRTYLTCAVGLTTGLTWPLRHIDHFGVGVELGVFIAAGEVARHGYARCN